MFVYATEAHLYAACNTICRESLRDTQSRLCVNNLPKVATWKWNRRKSLGGVTIVRTGVDMSTPLSPGGVPEVDTDVKFAG